MNLSPDVKEVLRNTRDALLAYNEGSPAPAFFNESGQLRVLAKLEALLQAQAQAPEPEPAARPRCPKCGGDDVTVRCDAYSNYTLWGFDAKGDPILLDDPDVQTFDDRTYVCDDCSHEDTTATRFLPDEESRSDTGTGAPDHRL